MPKSPLHPTHRHAVAHSDKLAVSHSSLSNTFIVHVLCTICYTGQVIPRRLPAQGPESASHWVSLLLEQVIAVCRAHPQTQMATRVSKSVS